MEPKISGLWEKLGWNGHRKNIVGPGINVSGEPWDRIGLSSNNMSTKKSPAEGDVSEANEYYCTIPTRAATLAS